MVEHVLERRRDAVIVLAADDDEGVGGAVEARQPLEHVGRRALLVFLVHAVEQREAQLGGVDQRGAVAAALQLRVDEARGLDALAGFADRAVEDGNGEGHVTPPLPYMGQGSARTTSKTGPLAPSRTARVQAATRSRALHRRQSARASRTRCGLRRGATLIAPSPSPAASGLPRGAPPRRATRRRRRQAWWRRREGRRNRRSPASSCRWRRSAHEHEVHIGEGADEGEENAE